jgi:hypothetical protein
MGGINFFLKLILDKALFPLDQVDEEEELRIQEYGNRRVGLVKRKLDNKEILS